MKWSHRYFLYFCFIFMFFYFFSFLFSIFMSGWRIVVAKLWEVPAHKAQWLPEHAEGAWPGRKKWRNVAARGKKKTLRPSFLPSSLPPKKAFDLRMLHAAHMATQAQRYAATSTLQVVSPLVWWGNFPKGSDSGKLGAALRASVRVEGRRFL